MKPPGIDHGYVVAVGSNMRVPGIGPPRAIIHAVSMSLESEGVKMLRRSKIVTSKPVGPSRREYANAAMLVGSHLAPQGMLAVLQAVEQRYGRQRRGQRWRARAIDLDIILWSGGVWSSRKLTIPHPRFHQRNFVLAPAAEIAPHWRDPRTRLTLRQLAARAS